MSGYTIKATVTVEVEMFIDVDTEAEAKSLFSDNLAMAASLLDTKVPFDVYEDSIIEVKDIRMEATD